MYIKIKTGACLVKRNHFSETQNIYKTTVFKLSEFFFNHSISLDAYESIFVPFPFCSKGGECRRSLDMTHREVSQQKPKILLTVLFTMQPYYLPRTACTGIS